MFPKKYNPYAPSRYDGCQLKRKPSKHSAFLTLLTVANVLLTALAMGLRHLQFAQEDPYMNPVADIATVFWLLAIGVGITGVAFVAIRLVHRKPVPIVVMAWFVLVGIYVGWFLFNFMRLMMT